MKPVVRNLTVSVATAISLVSVSNGAHASGFALIEYGGSGMGNAFAGAAAVAEDATTVQFNPAGMVMLEGRQATGVMHLIFPKSDFSNTGSTGSTALGSPALTGNDDDGGRNAIVPNFYYVMDIDDKMKFGMGINTPFGLATKYDDSWVGRYHAVESDVKTVNFNPNISYKQNDKLSFGFGVTAQYVDVVLSSAVDLGAVCYAALGPAACTTLGVAPQLNDGFARLTGDNWALGWNAGFLYQLSSDTRMGLAYRSEIKQEVSGDADFTVPGAASFATASGAFVDTGLSATITLPDSLAFSIYHDYNDKWAVLADVTWTGWSDFQELRIIYDNKVVDGTGAVISGQPDSVTTEDWDDSFRYSVGLNYRLNEKILLRTGLAYDETPIPSAERRTPRVPGNDRTWLSLGAQYKVDKSIIVDIGYTHLFVSDTPINNEFESSIPTLSATLKGEYTATVDILSAQATWKF